MVVVVQLVVGFGGIRHSGVTVTVAGGGHDQWSSRLKRSAEQSKSVLAQRFVGTDRGTNGIPQTLRSFSTWQVSEDAPLQQALHLARKKSPISSAEAKPTQ